MERGQLARAVLGLFRVEQGDRDENLRVPRGTLRPRYSAAEGVETRVSCFRLRGSAAENEVRQ